MKIFTFTLILLLLTGFSVSQEEKQLLFGEESQQRTTSGAIR